MDASRKPLAKVEGRRLMPLSGLTIAWRGTPSLDDWWPISSRQHRRNLSSPITRLSGR